MQAFATRNNFVRTSTEAFDNCVNEWVQASPPGERYNRRRVGYLIREAYGDHATSLDLSSSGRILQKLSFLPSYLAQLDSVTDLNVSFNELMALPALPPNLTNLDARVNALQQLPPLPKTLTRLEAQENALTEIADLPPDMAHLSLHDNRLTRLPALPPNLTYLGVVHNQLTTLPELPDSLAELSACQNRLVALPRLPPGLGLLAADPRTISASIERLQTRYAALTASGNAYLTPVVATTDGSAPAVEGAAKVGIGHLSAELAREITTHFVPGSPDAANLAATSKQWRAMLQPRGRQRSRIGDGAAPDRSTHAAVGPRGRFIGSRRMMICAALWNGSGALSERSAHIA